MYDVPWPSFSKSHHPHVITSSYSIYSERSRRRSRGRRRRRRSRGRRRRRSRRFCDRYPYDPDCYSSSKSGKVDIAEE